MEPTALASSERTLLQRALTPHNLYAAYQPIVDLGDRSVVAYEALARWRDPDLNPGVVFGAVSEPDDLVALDWACRAAALRGALDAGLARGQTLFVNAEPLAFAAPVPEELLQVLERATGEFRIVIELTERSLLHSPREVLRIVDWARSRGWGIALDDVGAEPDSLTMLPFVVPDVIKLDISLIQEQPTAEQGRVMAAVLAHAETTGSTILAEGIETTEHLEQARMLGATLGQGWHFGRPGMLRADAAVTAPIGFSPVRTVPATPFSLVANSGRTRIGTKRVLLGMSHHLESLGCHDSDLIVLAAFQTADRFTPATARRYETLGRQCAIVGALGAGMSTTPVAGVRGAHLAPDDDLAGEWTLVVVGAHYAGALIAKDRGEEHGADGDRRFEFVVTHDRLIVLDAARSLMSRLLPLS